MSEINVRRADRVVTSYGSTVQPKDDCDGYVLTAQEDAAYRAAYATAGPRCLVTYNVDGSFTGTPGAEPTENVNITRVKAFLGAASGTATDVQRDEVIKSIIRIVGGAL